MKYILAIISMLLIMSCSHNAITIKDGDEIIQGIWGGYVIDADGMKFKTNIGIRTVAHQVELVGHDWTWYMWSPGYGEPVERIE